ncbi:MAG: hypothetical protein QNK36_15145 [Colwellia sp.]|nr:hypothetical protein [Colwellia sp.]
MSIEKFSGTFGKDGLGVTQLPTKTVQSIRDSDALAYWTYLSSKPDTWLPNQKELQNHFTHGRDKSKKTLSKLVALGLMSVTQSRSDGKFQMNHFQLHLYPKPLDTSTHTPLTEKPLTVKPSTVNQTHRKHREKQNIELTNNIFKEKNDYENDELSLYDKNPPSKKQSQLEIVVNNNPHNLPTELIEDWLEVRKTKKARVTKTAVKQLNKELSKCIDMRISPIDAMETAIANGWVTVKAAWIKKTDGKKTDTHTTGWFRGNEL